MSNPFTRIHDIINGADPRRLYIPRSLFLFIALITAALHLTAFLLRTGIFVIVSVALMFASLLFVRLYYGLWIRYYSRISFAVVMLSQLFVTYLLAEFIRFLWK